MKFSPSREIQSKFFYEQNAFDKKMWSIFQRENPTDINLKIIAINSFTMN